MANVVLFHHAHGLTPGVTALADRLREAGNTVSTPDLYEGRTFQDLDAGVAHASEVGFGEIIGRGESACAEVSGPTVFAGMSLGVLPAQKLAQTSPLAAGAVLLHSCVPSTELADGWPAGVPVQVHAMDGDPWFVGDGDIDAARGLVAEVDDAELFLHPGTAHLFTDESLPDHDATATDLVVARILALLARIDGA